MQNTLTLIFSFFVIIASCQVNDLSVAEYNNLTFGGVYLTNIIGSEGNSSTVQSLFSSPFSIVSGEEPTYWLKYDSNSIFLEFQDGKLNQLNSTIYDYQLTNIQLLDNSNALHINGVDVSVGDHINVLGSSHILTTNNGTKKIIFRIGSELIRINFNQSTFIITHIEYLYINT